MSYLNTNIALGLRNGPNTFQAGISDVDSGNQLEAGTLLPWLINPVVSWMDYDCLIACQLDSGIIVTRILPQSAQPYDTLGGGDVASPTFANLETGVNLVSQGQFQDIVQRMAHSIYYFCLMGTARRVGYQITIPKLLTFAGVPAIPHDQNPQRAFNKIVGNASGIPIWGAKWELWYTVAVPPKQAQNPPANLAEHVSASSPLPTGIQIPISAPDQMSMRTAPQQLGQPPVNSVKST